MASLTASPERGGIIQDSGRRWGLEKECGARREKPWGLAKEFGFCGVATGMSCAKKWW